MAEIGNTTTTTRITGDYNILPKTPGDTRPPTQISPGEFVPLPTGGAAALGMSIPMMPDGADLVAMVNALKNAIQETELKTGAEQAKDIKDQKTDLAKERLDKLQEAREEAEKAKKSGLAGEIFGWIAAAAMIIAGAILVATGVGGALGAALLVGGITMAVMQTLNSPTLGKAFGLEGNLMDSMLNAIVDSMVDNGLIGEDEKEKMKTVMHAVFTVILTAVAVAAGTLAGGPLLGLAMATQVMSSFFTPENLENMGMNEKDAPWAALGINIGLAVVGLAAGAGAAKLASSGSQVADASVKATNTAIQTTKELTARIASAVAGGISATATIGQGASQVSTAVIMKEAESLRAQGKEMEAFFLELQAKFDEQKERLQEIVQQIQENMGIVMSVLNQTDQSAHKINQMI
jgi:hypothetical protein